MRLHVIQINSKINLELKIGDVLYALMNVQHVKQPILVVQLVLLKTIQKDFYIRISV